MEGAQVGSVAEASSAAQRPQPVLDRGPLRRPDQLGGDQHREQVQRVIDRGHLQRPGWLPAASRYAAPRAAGAASPRSLSTPGGTGLPAGPAGSHPRPPGQPPGRRPPPPGPAPAPSPDPTLAPAPAATGPAPTSGNRPTPPAD